MEKHDKDHHFQLRAALGEIFKSQIMHENTMERREIMLSENTKAHEGSSIFFTFFRKLD